jgi:hypothetical protein
MRSFLSSFWRATTPMPALSGSHLVSSSSLSSNLITSKTNTGHFWPVVKILSKIDCVVKISRFLSWRAKLEDLHFQVWRDTTPMPALSGSHLVSSGRFNSIVITKRSTGHFWPVVKTLSKIEYIVKISRFLS